MAKYAVLSDVHSNIEALTAVLEKCEELGVEHYISLGDIVGYNADPVACLRRIRELPLVARVLGNHDEYVGGEDQEMLGFNPSARYAVLWTREQLSEEERNYLVSGVPYRTAVAGANMTLVHATLDSPDNWGYIFDAHHATDNFSYQFTQLCFCGHSHVPVAFCKKPITGMYDRSVEEIEEWGFLQGAESDVPDERSVEIKPGFKYLFNVGSIGQPRNHDPRSSFAVYDSVARTVTRYALPYNVALTQQKVLDAGLPERLASRLSAGS